MVGKKTDIKILKLAKQGTLEKIQGDLIANEIENRWESSYTRKYKYNGMSVEFTTPYDPWSYPEKFTEEWEICVTGLVGDIFQDISRWTKMDQVEKERGEKMLAAFDAASKCTGCLVGKITRRGLTQEHVALHRGLQRHKLFEECKKIMVVPTKEELLKATESDKSLKPYLAQPYRSPFERVKEVALEKLGIDPVSIPKK